MEQEALNPSQLDQFTKLVFKHTGITMTEKKQRMLSNRLKSRVKALKLQDFDQYYDIVKSDRKGTGEVLKFIDAVTTNETYFWRAPKIWEYFSNKFLPEWFKAHKATQLKVWCNAASSGEEPYLIAMLCQEFAEKNPGFLWTLYASDISEEMLERCKGGRYKGRSIEKLPKHLLRKYFDGDKDDIVEVKKELKKKIRFFQHNLQESTPYRRLDIIFMRNVMIYFDHPTKESVLKHMESALQSDGVLVIGESEGLVNTESAFKLQQPSIYTMKV